MASRHPRVVSLALFSLLIATTVSAFQEPPPGRVLPNFDARVGHEARMAPAAGLRNELRALEAKVGPELRVRFGPDGRLRWIHALGQPLDELRATSPEDGALAFLRGHQELFGFSDSTVTERVFLERASSGITHLGLRQLVDGVPVFTGFIRVDFDREQRVIAVGLAEVRPQAVEKTRPTLSPADALERAAVAAGVANFTAHAVDHAASRRLRFASPTLKEAAAVDLQWFPLGDQLPLAWRVELRPSGYPARYLLLIDASTGELLYRQNLMQYVDTRANVFAESPDRGPRTMEIIYDADANVKIEWPRGWIDADITVGNNVFAQDDRAGDDELTPGITPGAIPGTPQVFDPVYTTDPAVDLDLAVVNLFWAMNYAHAHFYRLGFDEAAGNFQSDNFGRGGAGGDPVLADAQDAADTLFDVDPANDVANNANFSTPADGGSGRVQMYLWNNPPTLRDGDLDVDIIVHEFLHGVSTRLVGGRENVTCLFQTQAGAMGEAWGDFFAGSLFNDPVVAEHSTQDFLNGIRIAPLDGDSFTYADLCTLTMNGCEVHADGEIWAQALWELRAAFVSAYGLDRGRADFEQLVIDAMKLSPCNPSFLDMRDAILMADSVRFLGANRCRLWQGFAQNGMGLNAADNTAGDDTIPIEDFTLPAICIAPTTTSDVRWQFAEVGCDSRAQIAVTDADLVLPATVIVQSATGDLLTLALSAAPGGSPAFVTAEFVVIEGAIVTTDGILQAIRGDVLTASYFDATSSTTGTAVATMVCQAALELLSYHIVDGTCDDDSVPGFPDLPGFLDAGESAIIEVEVANREPFMLENAAVQLASSNPKVTVVPVSPIAVGTIPATIGSAPGSITLRFLAKADSTVVTGDTTDLALTFTATGYDGVKTPIQWTLRLNLDYQVATRSFAESFETTSPTIAGWTHATTVPTPPGDEWKLVNCNAAAGLRSYKNGGGAPACGNYTDNQGDPYLATPPLRIQSPGAEAGRLSRLQFQHDVQLGVPTDPLGGVCDAEVVVLMMTNDPTTIDTSDPLTLFVNAIGGWTVIPLLGIDDNTMGFEPQNFDFLVQPAPAFDPTADAYLTWLFLPDVTNDLAPPGVCTFFPAVGEGYYIDDMLLEWEEVTAVPQSTLCTPECKALAVSTPSAAYSGCALEPVPVSGATSLVVGCSGPLEYRWSGAELGPPGPFTAIPDVTVMPAVASRYDLEVRCTTDVACTDSTQALIVPAGRPPVGVIGNALRATRNGTNLRLDWSLAPLTPRDYNLHETTDKTQLTDTTIGAQPIIANPVNNETVDLPWPALDTYYETYGRDGCTGISVIP